jgi:hypothetical protein
MWQLTSFNTHHQDDLQAMLQHRHALTLLQGQEPYQQRPPLGVMELPLCAPQDPDHHFHELPVSFPRPNLNPYGRGY